MSGLASFFQPNNVSTDNQVGEAVQYDTSLFCTTRRHGDAGRASPHKHASDTATSDIDMHSIEPAECTVAAESHQQQQQQQQQVANTVPYDEWRKKHCRALQEFIHWRLSHSKKKQSISNVHSRPSVQLKQEEEDKDEWEDANHFETQPSTFPPRALSHNQRHMAKSDDADAPSQRMIPLQESGSTLQDCFTSTMDCDNLDDLSLESTQVLHLSFSQLYLLWTYHDIQSRQDLFKYRRIDSSSCHSIHSNVYPPPTLEDGPLFPVYRHVLPMDILTYPCPIPTTTHRTNPQEESVVETQQFIAQVASHAFQTQTKLPQEYPTRRIRLYFYDTYAYCIHQILSPSALKENPTIYISIENIPSHCIFPMSFQHQQQGQDLTLTPNNVHPWNNHHTTSHPELLLAEDYGLQSPYAICVGGISGVKLPHRQKDEYVSFHSDSLCIRILLVYSSTGRETKEYRIDSKWITSKMGYSIQRKVYYKLFQGSYPEEQDGKLLSLYQQYKIQQQQKKKATTTQQSHPVQPILPMTNTGAVLNPNTQRTPNIREGESSTANNKAHSRTTGPLHEEGTPHRSNISRQSEITSTPSIHLKDMEGILEKHQAQQYRMKEIPCFISTTIYSVVLGFSSPTLTRSGSYSMNITLIDPSLPLEDLCSIPNNNTSTEPTTPPSVPHITLIMFATRPESLPKLQRAGDVLCIRGFKIQTYKDEVQLLGQVLGKSNDCWYALCRPQHTVLEAISSNPTTAWNLSCELSAWMIETKDMTFMDINQVVESWKWGYHRLCRNPTIKSTSRFNIGDLEYLSVYSLDIDVMITGTLPAPINANGPKGYLRVWDGTGISISYPLPAGVSSLRIVEDGEDPPSLTVTSIQSIIQQLNQLGQVNEALEPPKALCGSVINVTVWETVHWELIQNLSNSFMNVGKFIRLRNVILSSKAKGDAPSLNLCTKSWLTPLPDTVFEIGDILRMHATRIHRKEPYNPTSGTLPYPLLPLNLKDLMDNLPTPTSVPLSFVVIKESIRPLVDPNVDGALKALIVLDPKDGLNKFLFSMRISDMTASLDVVVHDAAGQRLFGVTAGEFLASSPLFNQQMCTMTSTRLLDLWSADSRIYYKGTVTSFTHGGHKRFCLKTIE